VTGAAVADASTARQVKSKYGALPPPARPNRAKTGGSGVAFRLPYDGQTLREEFRMSVGIDRRTRRRVTVATAAFCFSVTGPAASTPRDGGGAERARAVLADRCYRCHGADGSASKGVFVLDRDRLLALGAVVPGDSSSPLLRLVESGAMPVGGPRLDAAELGALREWVLAGAPAWQSGGTSGRHTFLTESQILDAIRVDLDGEPAAARTSRTREARSRTWRATARPSRSS
jgi:mono/diheme cytochrome c family protein